MNPSPALMPDYMTWSGLWITLLAIATGLGAGILTRTARNSWRATGQRIDADLAAMANDPIRVATSCDLGMHPGPLSRYSSYAIWLCCGQREEQAYDQDLDSTDLGQWNKEMDAS